MYDPFFLNQESGWGEGRWGEGKGGNEVVLGLRRLFHSLNGDGEETEEVRYACVVGRDESVERDEEKDGENGTTIEQRVLLLLDNMDQEQEDMGGEVRGDEQLTKEEDKQISFWAKLFLTNPSILSTFLPPPLPRHFPVPTVSKFSNITPPPQPTLTQPEGPDVKWTVPRQSGSSL